MRAAASIEGWKRWLATALMLVPVAIPVAESDR
jgi:hypothetical protein